MGENEGRVALETMMMKNHIEQRIMPNLVYRHMLYTGATPMPTIVGARATLLDPWIMGTQATSLSKSQTSFLIRHLFELFQSIDKR